jgi:hypothetical protein
MPNTAPQNFASARDGAVSAHSESLVNNSIQTWGREVNRGMAKEVARFAIGIPSSTQMAPRRQIART